MALSPMMVFLLLYLVLSLVKGSFYAVPVVMAFLGASLYSLLILSGNIEERITTFCRGAGNVDLMMMILIFILAGAFAAAAKGIGADDATVNMVLYCLPDKLVIAGLFLATCLVSTCIGTSVGTIAALIPIAVGLAQRTGLDTAMMAAVVVGGAFFGDNLSFISDTTIVATKSQGCKLSDKFRMNLRIVSPVALVVTIVYVIIGMNAEVHAQSSPIDLWLITPYAVVLLCAVLGVNVMLVLVIGIVLCGVIGMSRGVYDVYTLMAAMNTGIMDNMSELIVATLLAACMAHAMMAMGGVDFILHSLTSHVRTRRGAEMSIAAMVTMTDFATANNTIAILTVGPLARNIAERFHIDPRRTASILDTFSCFAQSVIPYGMQLLTAAKLSGVSPVQIMPWLFYPLLLGVSSIIWIFITAAKEKKNE